MDTPFDENGNPVEGVKVDINGEKNHSNKNGRWAVNNVSEGRVNIVFYKSGYKVITMDWICYPLSYIDCDNNDLDKTPNHVRNGDKAITLEIEMEYIDYKKTNEKKDFVKHNTSVVLTISGEIGELGFSIEIEDVLFNENQSFFFIYNNNSLNSSRIFGLKSGRYNISLSGEYIKDLCITDIIVSKNESVELYVNIKKPEIIVLREIDWTMNHILIAFNFLYLFSSYA